MSVIVSDHALVRYLERVHGIDMDFFQRACANECEEAVAMGARAAKIGGHWFLFDGARLTTVLPAGGRPNSQDRKRWKRRGEIIDNDEPFAEAAE